MCTRLVKTCNAMIIACATHSNFSFVLVLQCFGSAFTFLQGREVGRDSYREPSQVYPRIWVCRHMKHIYSVSHHAYIAGCCLPTPPPHGFLGNITSLQEERMVTFQCNPGFVPSQQMMSVCTAIRHWTPDPAELVCRGRPDYINNWVSYTCTVYKCRW